MRTSARTAAGCCVARCSATRPPKEWPSTTTGGAHLLQDGRRRPRRRPRRPQASGGGGDAPKPGRSRARAGERRVALGCDDGVEVAMGPGPSVEGRTRGASEPVTEPNMRPSAKLRSTRSGHPADRAPTDPAPQLDGESGSGEQRRTFPVPDRHLRHSSLPLSATSACVHHPDCRVTLPKGPCGPRTPGATVRYGEPVAITFEGEAWESLPGAQPPHRWPSDRPSRPRIPCSASWPAPGPARPGCSPSGWPAGSATAPSTPTGPSSTTFSRKAAEELRTRLWSLGVSGVKAGTFHRTALGLLREHRAQRGRPEPQLLPDRRRLLAEVVTGDPRRVRCTRR